MGIGIGFGLNSDYNPPSGAGFTTPDYGTPPIFQGGGDSGDFLNSLGTFINTVGTTVARTYQVFNSPVVTTPGPRTLPSSGGTVPSGNIFSGTGGLVILALLGVLAFLVFRKR